MRIGILGTGTVGQTIGSRLVELGHEVRMGSRTSSNEAAQGWSSRAGERGSAGTFADAAGFGELVFNCTAGAGALDAAGSVAAHLQGKVLVDVSNPLAFPEGGPPTLFVGMDDSLGEQIQRTLPETSVVKALNTVTAAVMVEPASVGGDHVLFICGDDDQAKGRATGLLGELGWPSERILDLGGIDAARATEGYLLLWLRLMGAVGDPRFNIAVHR